MTQPRFRCWLFCSFLLLAGLTNLFGQAEVGVIRYNTVVSAGKFVPIYGPDPSQPFVQVRGSDPGLYVGRDAVKGTRYWAELWYGTTWDMDSFVPVKGTLVHFKWMLNVIDSNKQVELPEVAPRETAFLQLRVWESTVPDWAGVLRDPTVARGFSSVFTMQAGENCFDCVAPPTTGPFIEGFGLFYPVPEPSLIGWVAVGLGVLALCRRA